MHHFELRFSLLADELTTEILTYLLAEAGCNSFMEVENGLLAYIEAEKVDDASITQLLDSNKLKGVKYLGHEKLPEKNWNALWESEYEPVLIDGKCLIRAPFHPAIDHVEYDIVIMPRMSFGTAHHETTALMIGQMLNQKIKGKAVLDMGCGTAVLAILAKRMGAGEVVAIDNDEWAYNNALDNIKLNNVERIQVIKGDAKTIGHRKFDLILANINRNVLLADLSTYATAMNKDGKLIMSGFYTDDLDKVNEVAHSLGFELYISREKNKWIAAVFCFGSG